MVGGLQFKSMSKNKLKKKCFCLLTPFHGIFQYLNQKNYIINEISKSFDNFYLINSEKLEFFSKKKEVPLNDIKKKIPNNCIIIDPNNSKEFLNFAKNKELIIYCNIGRLWREFRIHYLLKKIDSKLIYLQNIGNFQTTLYPKARSFILQSFFKHVPHKFVILLSILKIFPTVDLRFLSNRTNYDRAINNFFYKLSKKNKYFNFFYTREFVLINSLAYDVNISNAFEITEEKIVMVDTNINHKDNVLFSGRISDEKVEKIYKILESFLKKISILFNKPVVVCIHPSSNFDQIRNYLKDFEIVKYKTKENIYKSFITFFYDSSSIVDAFLLKKKILVLENQLMGKSITGLCNIYPPKTGIIKINLNKEFSIENKEIFLQKIEETTKSQKYNNFVNNNLKPDGNSNGTKKFIQKINEKYFI